MVKEIYNENNKDPESQTNNVPPQGTEAENNSGSNATPTGVPVSALAQKPEQTSVTAPAATTSPTAAPAATTAAPKEGPDSDEESTGLENGSYDYVTSKGAPDNLKDSHEIVERGVVNAGGQSAGGYTLTPEEEQELKDSVIGYDKQIDTVNKAAAALPAEETEEQRKKREKQERSKRIIGAVSNGLRALSNLYFTTRYAPNMYVHEKGNMLNAVDSRIEKLKAERDKNHDAHMKYAIELGNLQNARAATLRELKAQQERRRMQRAEADRKAALHPLMMEKANSDAKAAGYKATSAKAEADHADSYWQKKEDELESRKDKNNRWQPSKGRGGGGGHGGSGGRGGSGGKGKIPVKDENGNVVDYASSYSEWCDKSVQAGSGEYYMAENGTDSWGNKKEVRDFRLKPRKSKVGSGAGKRGGSMKNFSIH